MLSSLIDSRAPLLKIEIPAGATRQTPWALARLSMERYYRPIRPTRDSWDTPTSVGYRLEEDLSSFRPGTDTHTVLVERKVAVTPLTLDMTANIPFQDFEEDLEQHLS